MRLYSEGNNYKLYQGNMLDLLEVVEPNSIDSIVTDPPYELNFMNKGWDNSGIAFQPDTWNKCLQVLKPGGYLLAFGGSRTYHRIACAIEDAGFEIRDTIMWLYGSGFPKSMDIAKAVGGKMTLGNANTQIFRKLNGDLVDRGNYGYASVAERQGARPSDYNLIEDQRLGKLDPTTEEAKKWQGWGTALKPSFEPIIVARKPFAGSLVDNVIKYGVGGINIDECRINFVNEEDYKITANKNQHEKFGTPPMTNNNVYGDYSMIQPKNYSSTGRFPANTILTYDDTDFEEVCGGFPETKSNGGETTMPDLRDVGKKSKESIGIDKLSFGQVSNAERKEYEEHIGRFPANTILTYDDTDFDEVCGGMPNTISSGGSGEASKHNTFANTYNGGWGKEKDCAHLGGLGDSGSAARYFYCAKASKKDRDEGLDELETKSHAQINNRKEGSLGATRQYGGGTNPFLSVSCPRKNTHPTVKPTDLMQYLVRLVTPNGGTVLDPFNGSGSTGKAVMWENRERLKNYKYIGIELTPEYLPISRARIEYAADPNNVIVREEVDEETEEVTKVSYKEVSLF